MTFVLPKRVNVFPDDESSVEDLTDQERFFQKAIVKNLIARDCVRPQAIPRRAFSVDVNRS